MGVLLMKYLLMIRFELNANLMVCIYSVIGKGCLVLETHSQLSHTRYAHIFFIAQKVGVAPVLRERF